MCDDYHSDIIFMCESYHNVQNFLNRLGIQRGCRLIEQDNRRLAAKSPRDRDSLLLSSRKSRGIYMCLVPKTYDIKIMIRKLFRFLL